MSLWICWKICWVVGWVSGDSNQDHVVFGYVINGHSLNHSNSQIPQNFLETHENSNQIPSLTDTPSKQKIITVK